MRLPPLSIRVALLFGLAGCASNAGAWRPPDLVPAKTPLATIVRAYQRSAGAHRATNRFDRFAVRAPTVAGSGEFDATAYVRGLDYRVDATLAGEHYEFGRSNGRNWRQTPEGVVRIIRSDLQSDALDRWPHALLGFDTRWCTSALQTKDARPLWVLSCRAPQDIAHWYYVDPATGTIVREVSREGSHVVVYSFDGATRWQIGGFGGPAYVRTMASKDQAVSAAHVALPKSSDVVFPGPADGSMRIPASFLHHHIDVTVRIGGHPAVFGLDTGTTQMLVDYSAAARLGLRGAFGHTVAPEVSVGELRAHNVPMQMVNLLGTGIDGLLGNEFFIGHVVHVDFRRRTVGVLPRLRFKAPPGTSLLPIDCSEGLPLAPAAIGAASGNRFVLDTGSYDVLLSQSLMAHPGAGLRFKLYRRTIGLSFLEGALRAQYGTVDALHLGPATMRAVPVYFVKPDPHNMDFPLDGIIGNSILHRYEWWFDYTGNRAWLRYTG